MSAPPGALPAEPSLEPETPQPPEDLTADEAARLLGASAAPAQPAPPVPAAPRPRISEETAARTRQFLKRRGRQSSQLASETAAAEATPPAKTEPISRNGSVTPPAPAGPPSLDSSSSQTIRDYDTHQAERDNAGNQNLKWIAKQATGRLEPRTEPNSRPAMAEVRAPESPFEPLKPPKALPLQTEKPGHRVLGEAPPPPGPNLEKLREQLPGTPEELEQSSQRLELILGTYPESVRQSAGEINDLLPEEYELGGWVGDQPGGDTRIPFYKLAGDQRTPAQAGDVMVATSKFLSAEQMNRLFEHYNKLLVGLHGPRPESVSATESTVEVPPPDQPPVLKVTADELPPSPAAVPEAPSAPLPPASAPEAEPISIEQVEQQIRTLSQELNNLQDGELKIGELVLTGNSLVLPVLWSNKEMLLVGDADAQDKHLLEQFAQSKSAQIREHAQDIVDQYRMIERLILDNAQGLADQLRSQRKPSFFQRLFGRNK